MLSRISAQASLCSAWSLASNRRTPPAIVSPPAPAGNNVTIDTLPPQQLGCLVRALWKRIVELSETNLTKREVASRAGMTVSWLDNSHSPKARKLRAIGIRYGTTQTSPVRFPLSEVIRICSEDEAIDI